MLSQSATERLCLLLLKLVLSTLQKEIAEFSFFIQK